MKSDRQLRLEVAWACRILAMEGHNDLTLGHVSARAADGQTVYIKRLGLGLDEVMAKDVISIDLDGQLISGAGSVHLEFPLHTEVYRLKPEVGAVIHTHPLHSIAWGLSSEPLKMLHHDSTLFYEGIPRFTDISGLITTAHQGHVVAQALGNSLAILLRHHGILVVGKDVPWAVLTALTLEHVIKLQLLSERLGDVPNEISAKEAQILHLQKFQDAFIDDYWNYLVRRARRAGSDVT